MSTTEAERLLITRLASSARSMYDTTGGLMPTGIVKEFQETYRLYQAWWSDEFRAALEDRDA